MPRLFAGLEIAEGARQRLEGLRGELAGARWVAPEDYHITLRFFGDVDGPTADALTARLAALRARPVPMQLSGLGVFGGRRPRALWAGVVAGPELAALQRACEQAGRAAGLEPQSRKYTPHVTLARFRNIRPGKVAAFISARGEFRSEPWIAERFVLYSARPHSGGGPYVIEAAFPLETSGGGGDKGE